MRDEQHGAREGLERGLQGLAALEVEVVRRLVEHEEVRARRDDERERQPAPLAARERDDRLLVLVPAGEEEAPEQVLRLRALELRRAHRAVRARCPLVELDLVLREVADLHAVAEAAGSPFTIASSSVVLPEPFGPTSATCSPRSSAKDVSSSSGFSPAASERRRLEHRPAAARRLEELEAERALPATLLDARAPSRGARSASAWPGPAAPSFL